MIAIDEFVKKIIIDCYTKVRSAQVIVAYRQDHVSEVGRDFTLYLSYIADKKEKGRLSCPFQVERGDDFPEHAILIRNMIAAHGIPAAISQGRDIETRIVEMNINPLYRDDFAVDQAAEILGFAPAAVANAYRRRKRREVSGACISGVTLFALGKTLRMTNDRILNRLNAYYTR
jgi:hypothetical protein